MVIAAIEQQKTMQVLKPSQLLGILTTLTTASELRIITGTKVPAKGLEKLYTNTKSKQ